MLSESTEMYLLSIYRLTEQQPAATISEIAHEMNLSLSSVSEKVKRLTETGLLEHEWRENVALSQEGKKIALNMLRKRRLLELFLVKMAGYDLYDVDEEACRLEHVISDRLADALDKMLGHPKLDPHGHPIPSLDGRELCKQAVPLSKATLGQKLKVCQLHAFDIELVKYIHQLGLKPGAFCKVLEMAPFDGPLIIQVGEKQHPIAKNIASFIGVEPIRSN
ncbi:iron (metal) dependent repressor, DtxR family [Chloroherpeton thalassium ATCC 35110]|uniref:Transcriptional regulator MntR n=1 Tax=Chloroherpeton thalassium (strain ATCC 35110 / GB-78) TaxID=517418 RepID=B3QXC9_CHLT3|nr:metal-dependent transcriptional regulator [Chloroherpeton thalassium]ACF13403.1 iron (metal) dependent repressor, DtxR family [Chloroherpeton thalassium ATCC 35110]